MLTLRGAAWYLAGAPAGFEPLVSETRLILRDDVASPLRASSELTAGARVTQGAVAARWLKALAAADDTVRSPLGDVSAVLLAGTTTEWLLGPPGLPAGEPRITLLLTPAAGGTVEAALQVASGGDTEVLLAHDNIAPADNPVLLWVNSPFASAQPGSLVATIEIGTTGTGATADWQKERSRAERMVRAASKRALDMKGQVDAKTLADAEIRRAIAGLTEPGQLRPCLVFLAHAGDAQLALDVAMIADEAVLERFAALIDPKVPAGDLGWHLESQVYRLYARALADREVHDAFDAVLLWHAGEVGRTSGAIEDVIRASTDLESLRRNLVAENTFALGGGNPGARVRAYDWLLRHDAAPEGFDPLGSARERRQALAAAGAAAAGPPNPDGRR